MWPFTSDKGKDTSEITKELPEHLQGFFEEKNPDRKLEGAHEVSPHQNRVNQVLYQHEKTNPDYSYQFDNYKRAESAKKVVGINCAELQQKVHECLRGWSFTEANHCNEEIKLSMECMKIQKEGLKKLYYDDCYNEKQCQQIRRVIDQLFVKNFGQFGDQVNEENQSKFNNDINGVFYKIWR
ncbi:hypothetical protein HYPBUDRAFT_147838 [Hyphopichia burtonii NRRL Y-1933]|uniref:Uncharacterized protein n=1 Tax=Hyphopichia burtonii NRRL Y-1933 TaxID=984485 RepID=A0A1E4RJR1_9ASCO|nr:hypothetical protein HYPBUDRAFT_147838 [Hyphopichia burtonii NRRL Y-1933]ODV67508.1 hypothetical protein HYPBUDRAFT_147838 [Hyphopichia burtonii NRRL Y-1933]